MRRTFLDEGLEQTFGRDGYVHVPHLVTDDDVARLQGLYAEFATPDRLDEPREHVGAAGGTPAPWKRQQAPGRHWWITIDESDAARRAELDAAMASLWGPVLATWFDDHRVLFSTFLTKGADEDSVLPLHQDPTVVDEAECRSVSVWIALDPMSTELDNGPVHVVPGSHGVHTDPRGTWTVPPYLDDLDALWDRARPVDVAPGDALIWDSRVLHGSPPNRTSRPRRSVTGVVVPAEAPLRHVYAEGDDHVVVAVDDVFYRQHSPKSLHLDFPDGLTEIDRFPVR